MMNDERPALVTHGADRWKRVDRLFVEALDRKPDEQAAFLREACGGDRDLEKEIASLLAVHRTVGSFMDRTAIEDLAESVRSKQDDFESDDRHLKRGDQLGPYQVVECLGVGGMGEVYRARDTKLNRDVALKVLPEHFAIDPDRLARLKREGQMLASLNHPNIAVIHGLEESGGACALVLELVEGPTLAERVKKGPLVVEDALTICSQIAAALEAAHNKAVTHRDLKPANVKVTPEGRVKLLDFGLAKAFANLDQHVTDATDVPTEAGRILGTPAYMSPEQARGKPIDKQTDIWAFGCVLYELLTGKRAFHGETVFDTMAAVLERDPDFQALRSTIPANVRDLLRRCLQKDPARRLHDIADARIEIEETLRAPAHRSLPDTSQPIASLAVLPFANASGDPQMDYLSDGLTESIILSLSQLPTLRVMARNTVFRYKGRSDEVQDVGRVLRVETVLTGRVLHRGDALVVSAELTDVDNGWQLWGGQYRRKATDIFATEDDITKEISDALRVKLAPGKHPLTKRYTDNVEAYHLYLKGRFYWGKRTADALNKGIRYFLEAIEVDPTYALAYAGLAECYVPLCFYGHVRPREAWLKARAAAQKALEIDPALSEAQTVLGWVKGQYDWDRSAAEEAFRAAVALDPNYSRARQGLAEILVATRRFSEAAAEIRRALELDPLSLSINAAVGLIAYLGRRYDEAVQYFRQTIEMDSTFYPAHWYLGLAYEQKGQFEEAAAELEKARALSNDNTLVLASLGVVYAVQRKEAEARHVLSELKHLSTQKYVSQFLVAVMAARLGDRDRAFACLEQACEDRCPWLGFMMVDPKLDILRDDSRFDDLARRMGLLQYGAIRPA